MIQHYVDGKPSPAWLAAMIEMESEGETTPVQLRTFERERLVNVGGVVLVPESRVAELLGMEAA